jgi:hypothetical protein
MHKNAAIHVNLRNYPTKIILACVYVFIPILLRPPDRVIYRTCLLERYVSLFV